MKKIVCVILMITLVIVSGSNITSGTFDIMAQSEFINIDGGPNGTTFVNPTPKFNWTSTENTSHYWLQISNTSGDWSDTSLVVNLSNISKINYPFYYNENATRISFTLSSEIALSNYHTYYCRVGVYIKNN